MVKTESGLQVDCRDHFYINNLWQLYMKKIVNHSIRIIKKTLWITPFISFILGYMVMKVFIPEPILPVPSVIGKNIVDTIDILSHHNLSVKIISKKEDATIKEVKTIQQIPAAGTPVKPRQTIHLIISEPTKTLLMPTLMNMDEKTWSNSLHNYKKIIVPIIPRESHYISKCIAQLPEKNSCLESTCTLYVTAVEDTYIIPNFIDHSVFEVEDILKKNTISYTFYEESRRPHHSLLETARIVEQQPVAGTLFSIKNPPKLYLTIEY